MQGNEKELAVFIGKKIKEYRKNKKITQKALGKIIGKSDNTISNYETGIIAPSQDSLFALAEALQVKVDDFFPKRPDSDGTLHRAYKLSDEDMDLKDVIFMKNLIDYIKTLDDNDRRQLLGNIELAVEFFKKTSK